MTVLGNIFESTTYIDSTQDIYKQEVGNDASIILKLETRE